MLLGIWRIDSRGITYMNNSVYAFSKANPSLPVFSMTATAIGYWAIGGYVPQYAGIGQNMAEQAYLFLDKGEENISNIYLLPNKYKFDANKLKEWGFHDKKLPFNSLVINQPIPFFQAYRTEVQFILLTFPCADRRTVHLIVLLLPDKDSEEPPRKDNSTIEGR